MALKSNIEWTDLTWNPVTGCSKISAGCENCYAERMANRLKAMGQANYINGFKVTTHKHVLNIPLKQKKSKTIFVNSMSDLFHDDIEEEFIHKVFDVMKQSPQHTFQILTKRAERMATISSKLYWTNNVWMGVSVENQNYINRIDYLKTTGAKVKFISFEPLIGQISKVNLDNIDWVIVGGESGYGARYMNPDWVRYLRDQCVDNGIPFYFKQWGGVNKKKFGREIDGKYWEQMPDNNLKNLLK